MYLSRLRTMHTRGFPVPAVLGNGDDPAKNLYWSAAFGARTYVKKSSDWKEVATVKNPPIAAAKSNRQSRISTVPLPDL
jgi:hypothetical protein